MAVGGVACGCAGDAIRSLVWHLNPFAREHAVVARVAEIGPYLYASLRSARSVRDVLVLRSQSCAALLEPEAPVTFERHGSFGRLRREGRACDVAGTASLARWRDARSRHPGPPLPRATARFQVIHRSTAGILLRGRFPLVSRVDIPSAYDLVALVPDEPLCERVARTGEASLLFRDAGSRPFVLLAGNGECPVAGFALPPLPGPEPGSGL